MFPDRCRLLDGIGWDLNPRPPTNSPSWPIPEVEFGHTTVIVLSALSTPDVLALVVRVAIQFDISTDVSQYSNRNRKPNISWRINLVWIEQGLFCTGFVQLIHIEMRMKIGLNWKKDWLALNIGFDSPSPGFEPATSH